MTDAELFGTLPADRGRGSTFGCSSLLPWGQIAGVITDASPTDGVIEQLSAIGVETLHADDSAP